MRVSILETRIITWSYQIGRRRKKEKKKKKKVKMKKMEELGEEENN